MENTLSTEKTSICTSRFNEQESGDYGGQNMIKTSPFIYPGLLDDCFHKRSVYTLPKRVRLVWFGFAGPRF